MATTQPVEKPKADSVRMKYTGPFRGTTKTVQLPIPLVAHSQALSEELTFTRQSDRQGPAFCNVPIEWVGALLAVGGRWKMAEDLTEELSTKIEKAKAACDARMEKFILENELVDA